MRYAASPPSPKGVVTSALLFGAAVGAMGRPDLARWAARIWRGGCIIRATFLNLITEAYDIVCIDWLLASPPPPITKAEMDAHRKELELMGTSGGLHH
jgi:hypothetical protein